MSLLAENLMEFAKCIARTPTMYGTTPEETHGMIKTVATIILHETSGKSLDRSLREVASLIRQSMAHIYPSDAIVPCLADESFPESNPSFEAFRRNCSPFLILLADRVARETG